MTILSIYFIAIMGAALLAGKLSTRMTLSHTQIQLVMILIAGFIIGITAHHLFPSSMAYIGGEYPYGQASKWALAGIVVMVFLLQILNFHQHEISGPHTPSINPSSLWGILFGLAIHSAIEGIILGAAMQSTLHDDHIFANHFGIFLVIFFHKPLDVCTIVGSLKAAGKDISTQKLFTILFSFITPVAMALAYWAGESLMDNGQNHIIGYVMAFSSGTFLCIALSDLLPEIQSHRHDRGKLFISFLVGIIFSYLMCPGGYH